MKYAITRANANRTAQIKRVVMFWTPRRLSNDRTLSLINVAPHTYDICMAKYICKSLVRYREDHAKLVIQHLSLCNYIVLWHIPYIPIVFVDLNCHDTQHC